MLLKTYSRPGIPELQSVIAELTAVLTIFLEVNIAFGQLSDM